MKKFIAVAIAFLYGTLNIVYAQTNSNPVNGETGLEVNAINRDNATTNNIFYKNNIVAHFKEFTGNDLFELYPDFPKYDDSGNQTKDVFSYHDKVYNWIKVHPEFAIKYHINLDDLKLISDQH